VSGLEVKLLLLEGSDALIPQLVNAMMKTANLFILLIL
jgi:hypothetical protein